MNKVLVLDKLLSLNLRPGRKTGHKYRLCQISLLLNIKQGSQLRQ
jgi:hypothetical protein